MTASSAPMETHAPEPVRWQTTLHPYRSADRVPILLIAALVGGTCFVAGVAFSAMGAWPVFGFLGLDILVLYFALRLNLRRARAVETLTLTDTALVIDRVDHWGRHQQWSVPPHWLRVHITDDDRHQPRLELHTHGRIWTVAPFLRPEEKEELAGEIRDAVAKLGRPPGDERSFDD